MRQIIFILGMHRSGTSALAKGVNALGADMSETLVPANKFNPKGYWECADAVAINQALLSAYGSDGNYGFGFDPHDISRISTSEIGYLCSEVALLLKRRMSTNQMWAVKDPRMSLLLPIWKNEAAKLENVQLKPILSLRNPYDVFLSLKKRDGFDISTSFFLWLKYYHSIARALMDMPALVVDFTRLVQEPRNELSRIAFFLGIDEKSCQKDIDHFSDVFIDSQLNHRGDDSENAASWTETFPKVAKAYHVLKSFSMVPELDEKEWADGISQIETIEIGYHPAAKLKPNVLQAQLFIDVGNGFSEEDSLDASLRPHANQIEFSLKQFSSIRMLRFDPCSDFCAIRLINTEVHYLNSTIQEIQPNRVNSLSHDSSLYVFDTKDPHFEFRIDRVIKKIVFNFDFVAIGNDAFKYIIPRLTRNYFDLVGINEQLKNEKAALLEKYELAIEEHDKNKEVLKQRQTAELQRDEALKRIERLQADLQLESEKRQAVQQQIEDRNQRLDALTLDCDRALLQAKAASDERDRLNNEIDRYQKQHNHERDEALRRIERLQADLQLELEKRQAVQQQIEDRNQRLDALTLDCDRALLQAKAASDERDRLNNEIDQYRKQVDQALYQVKQATEQTQAIINEQDRFQSKLQDDAVKIEYLTNHTEQLESQLKRAIGKQKSAQKKINEAELSLLSHQRSSTLIIEQKDKEIRKLNETVGQQVKILSTLSSSPERLYAQRLINRRKRLPMLGRYLRKKIAVENEAKIHADIEAIKHSGLFDAQHYKAHVSEDTLGTNEPIQHYCMYGWKEGRNPSLYFNTKFYLLKYPDVANSGMNPFVHYIKFGKSEGRLPSAQENPTNISASKDLTCGSSSEEPDGNNLSANRPNAANENFRGSHDGPKEFYDEIGLITQSGLFDEQYYLKENPDISDAEVDPIWHYFVQGWKENRNPSKDFDTAFYLEKYTDVREAGINPLIHYITQGKMEGRRPIGKAKEAAIDLKVSEIKKVITNAFDGNFYLDRNPDVKAAGVDPLEHFIHNGWKEGRDPNPYFSVRYYLSMNPELEETGINPLYDYLKSGKTVDASLPGGYRHKILLDQHPIQIDFEGHDNPSGFSCLNYKQLLHALKKSIITDSKKAVLAFSHDDYTKITGGVQLCLAVEQDRFSQDGHYFLQVHPAKSLNYLLPSDLKFSYLLGLVGNGQYLGVCRSSDLLSVLKNLMQEPQSIRELILIVHSLLGHSPDFILEISRELSFSENFFWLHDYYSICPCFTLLRNNISCCNAPKDDSPACNACLYGEERGRHRELFFRLFKEIEFKILSPSRFTLDLWTQKAYLNYRETAVIEHCSFVNNGDRLVASRVEQSKNRNPIRIAFLGLPAVHKGWPIFSELASNFKEDNRYEFYHIGNDRKIFPECKFIPATVGPNNRSAMIEALQKADIDYALIWPIWPETFCFTAYEAIAAGALIISNNDSGNVEKIVRNLERGLIYDTENELMDAFKGNDIRNYLEFALSEGIPTGHLEYSGITAELLSSMKR